MVASQARFVQSVQPESADTIPILFVGEASPDIAAVQLPTLYTVTPWPDGSLETQDPGDGLWYPCTFHSLDTFLSQIYFDRSQPTDFAPGNLWRVNSAVPGIIVPASGVMV
jgi:hypothetical protein